MLQTALQCSVINECLVVNLCTLYDLASSRPAVKRKALESIIQVRIVCTHKSITTQQFGPDDFDFDCMSTN